MAMFGWFVVSLCVFFCLTTSTAGQLCMGQADFTDCCSNTYDGVAVGGRCFFLARSSSGLGNAISNWATGFDACQNLGDDAVFAQIYSEAELLAIQQQFNPTLSDGAYIWVALANRPKAQQNSLLIGGNTRWYSTAYAYDSRINANNTNLRLHPIDDIVTGNDECLMLYWCSRLGRIAFGDEYCSNDHRTLCMVANKKQDYTITNGCFSELPIVTQAGTTLSQCATSCANTIWCRTFSYHPNATLCDLFALHAVDASGSMKTGISDCYTYTFMP